MVFGNNAASDISKLYLENFEILRAGIIAKYYVQVMLLFVYNRSREIDHFTVVCLVAWPLNESEAGVDLDLIEPSLLFLCKSLVICMRTASLA